MLPSPLIDIVSVIQGTSDFINSWTGNVFFKRSGFDRVWEDLPHRVHKDPWIHQDSTGVVVVVISRTIRVSQEGVLISGQEVLLVSLRVSVGTWSDRRRSCEYETHKTIT